MKSFLLPFLPLVSAGINWDIYEHGVVDSFKWSRPFPDDGSDPGGFHVHCKTDANFHAQMYKLSDLPDSPPTGLAPWHDGIEDFMGHIDFPGSWDGVDHKGQDREVVVMKWREVPEAVKRWIKEQWVEHPPNPAESQVENRDGPAQTNKGNPKRWLFGVFEKPKHEGEKIHKWVNFEEGKHLDEKDWIVVFAAGSVYEILPLWVSEGSKCERALSNLAKYKPQAIDDAILAWVIDHTKPHRDLGKRDITFKVEAMSVTESEDGKRSRLMWEKLHRTVKRNERRMQKEERLRIRKEMEEGRVKDEL
ncbi:hypothetical protein OQA88_5899 [Cercophora sp. LCS_1]